MKCFYKFSVLVLTVLFIVSGSASSQWFQQPSGTDEWLYSVCFLDEFDGWIVGWNGTILRTTDGGNHWISQSIDTNLVFFDVCFINAYNGFAVGEGGTILRTTDSGNNWAFQNSGTFWALNAVSFSDAANGTAVGAEGIIVRTTNGGYTWQSQVSNTYYPLNDVCFKDPLHGVIVGGSLTILRTTDGGENWIDESIPWPLINRAPHDLTGISFMDVNTGYAVGYFNMVLKTTDAGDNWAFLSEGYGHFWDAVSFSDENNGTIVCSDGIIQRTTDGGLSWETQQGGTYMWLINVCFTDPFHGTIVGESGIILRTNNGGIPVELVSFTGEFVKDAVILKWQTATETNNKGFEVERLKDSRITKLHDWEMVGFVNGHGTTTEENNYSFVDKKLESGSYVYRLKQIDFDGSLKYSTEVDVDISMPGEFILYQNYPNPFNPMTKIKWHSPVAARQTLKIYDVLGKEIITLIDEYRPAGRYETELDGSKYPAGVYFYRLIAGNFVDTKKLILMK